MGMKEETKLANHISQPKTGLLYEQMTENVLKLIQEKRIKSHEPIPSEANLAKAFGVSRMTAKLALEQLASRGIVYRLPRRGTFLAAGVDMGGDGILPSAPVTPEKLPMRSRKLIGIMVPDLDDYTSRIIEAVEQESRNYDCDLLVRISKNQNDEEECLKQLADLVRADGIILFPRGRRTCSDEVLKLRLNRCPIVIIDRVYREISIDCVHHDHYQGAYQMTKRLIELGHRDIGFVTIPSSGTTSLEERYQGYIQALLDHEVPVRMQLIKLDTKADPMLRAKPWSTSAELAEYLRNNSDLTAVFCADDYIGSSLLNTALSLGLRVPEQLSVCGFSDIQPSSLLPVPLTTVRQPAEQLGHSAMKLLMKRVKFPNESAVCVKIQTSIVERSSVAKAPLNGANAIAQLFSL